VGVVPIRQVCGSCAHGVFGAATGAAGAKVPKVGEYVWKDTFLALRLADTVATDPGQIGQPDHILTMLKTGKKVPKVAAPTGNSLCWFYTDATWTTASATPTPYVRVNGPAATIHDEPQWYTPDNLIPSDLYYASLFGPEDLKPGKHDWDALDQGLYGQWSWDKNLGGIDYTPDVSVGRAPVSTPAEASNFVAKVISYETAESRPTEYDRFQRMLLVAEHWDHAAAPVTRNATDKLPPDAWTWTYSYDAANQRSLVRAESLKEGAMPQLLAYLPGNVRRVIPYNHDGAARGWYYAKSGTDLSPSTFHFTFLNFIDTYIPIQTEFVVVRSPDPAELTPESYFFDPNTLDGSIVDTEKIRAYMQGAHPRVNQLERRLSDPSPHSGAGRGRPAERSPLCGTFRARLLGGLLCGRCRACDEADQRDPQLHHFCGLLPDRAGGCGGQPGRGDRDPGLWRRRCLCGLHPLGLDRHRNRVPAGFFQAALGTAAPGSDGGCGAADVDQRPLRPLACPRNDAVRLPGDAGVPGRQ
jgi:hypothetical protein